MPGPPLQTAEPSSGPPPARVDVVVIGGGIIGTTTALELADRGLAVALCEKGVIAGEQSSRNWGWVRMSRRDPREVELMDLSIRLWEGMATRVGADVGYRQCGIVVPFHSPKFRAENEEWLGWVADRQLAVGTVDSEELAALAPDMRLAADGALHGRRDGRAEPQLAAPAVARAARARGVAVLTECAVRRIETTNGAVSGVVTEHGAIACDSVVVAGGVWSRRLLRDAGVTLPQLRTVNSVLRTEPVEGGPEITVRGPDFAIRRRADGGYTVSTTESNVFHLTPDSFRFLREFAPIALREWRSIQPRFGRGFFRDLADRRTADDQTSVYERTRVLDPEPDVARLDHALARAAAAFPALRGARVAQRWAGAIDVTPDAVPVISAVANRPGLVIATGFSGHGFGLGPGAGRLAADLVTGDPPAVDPSDFRLSRFSDGSKITPLAGV